MYEVQQTIFQPSRLGSLIRLAESRVYSSLALQGGLHERILLAVRLCLTHGTAGFDTVGHDCGLIAEVVPVRFVAGHHLGHHILFEHVAVCQCV
jgi:hypothetical protein